MTAKAAKAGKKYKVTAHRSPTSTGTPTGKVIAKLGKKTYVRQASTQGQGDHHPAKAAKGKKVTVKYKGDGYTEAAKATRSRSPSRRSDLSSNSRAPGRVLPRPGASHLRSLEFGA